MVPYIDCMCFPKPQLFPAADQDLSLKFKAFAHPARLHILRLLSTDPSLCVTEIAMSTPLTRTSISGHLEILRRAGLVHVLERGLYNYYSVDVEQVEQLVVEFEVLALEVMT